MKNPFKAIWNYFFPEKKSIEQKFNERAYVIIESKPIQETIATKTQAVLDNLKWKDETKDSYFDTDREIGGFSIRKLTKNDFRKLALSKGFDARYSGNTKRFYINKISL